MIKVDSTVLFVQVYMLSLYDKRAFCQCWHYKCTLDAQGEEVKTTAYCPKHIVKLLSIYSRIISTNGTGECNRESDDDLNSLFIKDPSAP